MHIGIVAPPWVPVPPPGYGGTELVLDGLARGLAALGHRVSMFATGDSTCPAVVGWAHEEALGFGRVDAIEAEAFHVVEAYRQLASCDVIHDHTIFGLGWSAAGAADATVTTSHGPLNTRLGQVLGAAAGRVPLIAISRDQASRAVDGSVAAVIHHGIDVPVTVTDAGRDLDALFLGRMHPTKGVHIAARVARAAGVRLTIAAKMREPAEESYFHEMVRPLLGHGIEYIGEVSQLEKAHLLDRASCLLNPIQWPEPFGMVMIEALARGVPVVTCPIGAAPEIVDDGVTGFLRSDGPGLAAALLAAGALDRETCRAAAEARFSIRRMAAGHAALYASLLTPLDRPLAS
jgi:glycosyltransferase involved in cell wall biosynthesis